MSGPNCPGINCQFQELGRRLLVGRASPCYLFRHRFGSQLTVNDFDEQVSIVPYDYRQLIISLLNLQNILPFDTIIFGHVMKTGPVSADSLVSD